MANSEVNVKLEMEANKNSVIKTCMEERSLLYAKTKNKSIKEFYGC